MGRLCGSRLRISGPIPRTNMRIIPTCERKGHQDLTVMLLVSICYAPEVIFFEVLLVLLLLWIHSMLKFELRLGLRFHHRFKW